MNETMKQTEPAEALDKLVRFAVEHSLSFTIYWHESSCKWEVRLISDSALWISNDWPFLSYAVDAVLSASLATLLLKQE